MDNPSPPGIYLLIDFDWPQPLRPEVGSLARRLHDIVQDQAWIKETLAASGGIGAGPSSTWVFWLQNYAALDRLLRDKQDPVSQAYGAFFKEMAVVVERIREEVVFL